MRTLPAKSTLFTLSLAAAALVSPETASAAWTAPVDLSSSGGDAYFSQIAVAADGDSIIVWQFDDGADELIQAAAVNQAGVVQSVQTLSISFGVNENPRVGVDDDGNGVITWTRRNGNDVTVEVRTMSESGVLGLRQTLSDPAQDADSPDVAVDADGNALIVWEYGTGNNQRIQAVDRTAAGVVGLVQTLTVDPSFNPRVAMAADGHAAITWLGDDGTSLKVRAVTVSPTGTFGFIQTLSTAPVDAENAHVGVDAFGNAVVSWLRFTSNHFRVHARTMSAASVLGAPHTVSGGGQDAFLPEVAVGADGTGVITWQRDSRIEAIALSTADALGGVQTISVGCTSCSSPDVAVDDDGDAVITWERSSDNVIRSRTLSATGSLGVTETLSDLGQTASDASVGVDANGDAVAIWRRADVIQAATGP